MRRMLLITVALASLAFVAAPTPSQAATSVGFSVRIGDPYRGASLRFSNEPDLILVPRSRVYYVRNYDRDLYRYGGMWYLIDDGYWYRARSYRGPFIRVDLRAVPREVYYVPTSYRRHWGTPAGYGRDWDRDWRWDRERDQRIYQERDYRYRDRRYRDRGRHRGWDWNGDRDQSGDRNREGVRSRDFVDQNHDGIDDRDQVRDRNSRDRNRNDDQNQNDDQNRDRRDRGGDWNQDGR